MTDNEKYHLEEIKKELVELEKWFTDTEGARPPAGQHWRNVQNMISEITELLENN